MNRSPHLHRPAQLPAGSGQRVVRAGFTLIELLITISVMGILAALLIPQLLSARKSAVASNGQAHSANVYKVLNAALADDKDLSPSEVLDISGSSCMAASAGTPPYTWKPAPTGTASCTITENGNEFEVRVTMDDSGHGRVFVNGRRGS